MKIESSTLGNAGHRALPAGERVRDRGPARRPQRRPGHRRPQPGLPPAHRRQEGATSTWARSATRSISSSRRCTGARRARRRRHPPPTSSPTTPRRQSRTRTPTANVGSTLISRRWSAVRRPAWAISAQVVREGQLAAQGEPNAEAGGPQARVVAAEDLLFSENGLGAELPLERAATGRFEVAHHAGIGRVREVAPADPPGLGRGVFELNRPPADQRSFAPFLRRGR